MQTHSMKVKTGSSAIGMTVHSYTVLHLHGSLLHYTCTMNANQVFSLDRIHVYWEYELILLAHSNHSDWYGCSFW